MDLEGVTVEELQEAAAELTHLQTMARQGRALLDFQAPSLAPRPTAFSPLPPTQEVALTNQFQSPAETEDQPNKFPQAEREGSRGEGATPSSHPESSPRPAPPIPRQEQAQQSRTTRQAARQPQLQDYGFRVSGDKDGATPAPAHGCPNNQPGGSCFRARRLPSQWSTIKPE